MSSGGYTSPPIKEVSLPSGEISYLAGSRASDAPPSSELSSSSEDYCVCPDVMEGFLSGAILKPGRGAVFSVFVVSPLFGVIYLQWLSFRHIYPVPVRKLSIDMPHQNLPFYSSTRIVSPDLSLMPGDLCLKICLPLPPHYVAHLGRKRCSFIYPKYP